MSVEAVQTNEEYTQRLSNHDWEYSFSDEHAVWMRGAYEYKALKDWADVNDPDYVIWNQFAPRPQHKLKRI